jgi:hypothetical protein
MADLIVNYLKGVTQKIPSEIMYILDEYIDRERAKGKVIDVPKNYKVENVAETWLKIFYKFDSALKIETSDNQNLCLYFGELDSKEYSEEEIFQTIDDACRDFGNVGNLLKKEFEKRGELPEREIVNMVFSNLDLKQTDFDVIFEDSDSGEYLFSRLSR